MRVTPCVGVWIEINVKIYESGRLQRHSLRGSVDWNIKSSEGKTFVDPSLPAWECGLKFQQQHNEVKADCVTPCVGVWIEMLTVLISQILSGCHSLRGSVDWNDSAVRCFYYTWCHSLRGSVDWNQYPIFNSDIASRHSLRGSVDWNAIAIVSIW